MSNCKERPFYFSNTNHSLIGIIQHTKNNRKSNIKSSCPIGAFKRLTEGREAILFVAPSAAQLIPLSAKTSTGRKSSLLGNLFERNS